MGFGIEPDQADRGGCSQHAGAHAENSQDHGGANRCA
jgi:hypothetical protein